MTSEKVEHTAIIAGFEPYFKVLKKYGFKQIVSGENKSTDKLYRFSHSKLNYIVHLTKAKSKPSLIFPKIYLKEFTKIFGELKLYKNSNLKDYPKENGEKTQAGLKLSFRSDEELQFILTKIDKILKLSTDVLSINYQEKSSMITNKENAVTPENKEVIDDIEVLFERNNITKIEREVLVKQRIGQSDYRDKVLDLWDSKCSVTGCDNTKFLIASHIKAWHECRNHASDCVNEYNALALIPNLDKAFDQHLISFNDDGTIIIGEMLTSNPNAMSILGINKNMKLRKELNDEQKKFLAYHRKKMQEQDKKD